MPTIIKPILLSAFVAATLSLSLGVGAADEAPPIRDLSANTCLWEGVNWGDMNVTEQNAWAVLGWSAANWNTEDPAAEPASEGRKWTELSPGEQTAATSLGYDQVKWDGESCQ